MISGKQYLRSVFLRRKVEIDMHAKGMDQTMIETAVASGLRSIFLQILGGASWYAISSG